METREMWKKSGAWFFKGLPNYERPSSTSSTPTHISSVGRAATMSEFLAPRRALSCAGTPTRSKVKKLTIRVKDSSSSEEEEEEEQTNLGEISKASMVNASDGNMPSSPPVLAGKTSSDDIATPTSRLRSFGSIRSFIDGSERKLSNAFFFNRQNSQNDDTISCASTVATSVSSTPIVPLNNAAMRRESNHNRRSSVSSSWSISDSSSGNSASPAANQQQNILGHANAHCRDPLLGWLEICITYRSQADCLEAIIVRARDLPSMDAAGLTDPYCKLNIITAEGITKYTRWQRTKTVHKTRNPEFNETMQFVGVEAEELGNSLLYVAIFDEDKYGHDFLGAAKICLSTVQLK